MIDFEEAGRRTRLARERFGLTIADAAWWTGLSEATVRRYEGTWPAGFRTRTWAALAGGYGVTMEWLAGADS